MCKMGMRIEYLELGEHSSLWLCVLLSPLPVLGCLVLVTSHPHPKILICFKCVYVSEFGHTNVVPMEVREIIRFPGTGLAAHNTGNQTQVPCRSPGVSTMKSFFCP